jgi:hypothetical protein
LKKFHISKEEQEKKRQAYLMKLYTTGVWLDDDKGEKNTKRGLKSHRKNAQAP